MPHVTRARSSVGMSSPSIWQRTMPRSPPAPVPKAAPTLQALPRELIKLICTHLYNPLHLTQQDRLSEW